MEKLSTLVYLAASARKDGLLYASSSYARAALSEANRLGQRQLAGKIMVLCRKNSQDRTAGHGVGF